MPLRVLDDPASVACEAAELVTSGAADAVRARGECSLALSGGRTPRELYALLAVEWSGRLPWERIGIWFADERAVPPESPLSNYRLVRETLLDRLAARVPRVHRMEGESDDLDAAAAAYEATLPEALDIVILGLGEDGHVASLFPHSPLLEDGARRVAVVRDSPKPPPARLTLAPAAIHGAWRVLVLATGEEKAEAVARARAPDADRFEVPAAMLRDRMWLVDEAAASRLPKSSRA